MKRDITQFPKIIFFNDLKNRVVMTKTLAYAADKATSPLAPFTLDRREPGPHDIQIEILFCGVCHSDIHTVRNEWKGTVYPCVPGHEIVGRITKNWKKCPYFSSRRICSCRVSCGFLSKLRQL